MIWAVGMVYGTIKAYNVSSPTSKHFGGSVASIDGLGEMGYSALTAFALNVVVAAALTLAFRAARTPAGADETQPADYFADAGDPRVRKLPDPAATIK